MLKFAVIDNMQAEAERQQQELSKWKHHFTGHEHAERMAQTMRKLQLGYQQGKELQNESFNETSFDTVKRSREPTRPLVK